MIVLAIAIHKAFSGSHGYQVWRPLVFYVQGAGKAQPSRAATAATSAGRLSASQYRSPAGPLVSRFLETFHIVRSAEGRRRRSADDRETTHGALSQT